MSEENIKLLIQSATVICFLWSLFWLVASVAKSYFYSQIERINAESKKLDSQLAVDRFYDWCKRQVEAKK